MSFLIKFVKFVLLFGILGLGIVFIVASGGGTQGTTSLNSPSPVASGTYNGTNILGFPEMVTFQANSTYIEPCNLAWCSGTWEYENDSFVTDFIQEFDFFDGQFIQYVFNQEITTYNTAYTIDNGSKLFLGALEKIAGDASSIPGTYYSIIALEIRSNSGTTNHQRERTVIYEADGTWLETNVSTDSDAAPSTTSTTSTGTWTNYNRSLVLFDERYFLYEGNDRAYNSQ